MSPYNLKMSVKRLLQERKSRSIASQWDALGRAGSLGEVQSMLGTAFALLGPSWPVVEMAAFLWADLERPRRYYCNLASWPADVRELIEAEAVSAPARPSCARSRRSGPRDCGRAARARLLARRLAARFFLEKAVHTPSAAGAAPAPRAVRARRRAASRRAPRAARRPRDAGWVLSQREGARLRAHSLLYLA
jgi:hypothetical protein